MYDLYLIKTRRGPVLFELELNMNGNIPDSDDGKVVEITGDDVGPEMAPTPVEPVIQPNTIKQPVAPTKPQETGVDQRHRA